MANWEKIKIVRKKEDMQVGQIVPKKSYKVLEKLDEDGVNYDYMVTFRITEACDLKCNYCHWHSGKHYVYEDVMFVRSVHLHFDWHSACCRFFYFWLFFCFLVF